jgi:hypothetical protein
MRIAEINMRNMRNSAFRNVTTSNAERHLKTALHIAEQSPDASWEVRKDCLLSLADFYTLFDMKGRARRYYAAAWELLSASEVTRVARAADLESPVALVRSEPYPYANFEYDRNRGDIDPNEYIQGEIVVAFTINEQGRTENLRLVEAEPADFSEMEMRVFNAVDQFVYRPRYADGQAVPTGDQQYQARYFYLPSEYQAALDKAKERGPNQ